MVVGYSAITLISDALVALANGLDVTPLMTHSYGIDDAETTCRSRPTRVPAAAR
ncbi:MAG TPA: hypothetical protein VIT65_07550 [Microlunatus sp.]